MKWLKAWSADFTSQNSAPILSTSTRGSHELVGLKPMKVSVKCEQKKKKKQKTLGRISHNGTRFDHDNMCFTSADKTTIFSYSKESSIFLIFSSHN